MRVITLMRELGAEFEHSVLALDGNFEAARALGPQALAPLPAPAHKNTVLAVPELVAILRKQRPDLLLTYNWGAVDAVMAGLLARICPVIHTEDGFGPDEARRRKRRRVWARAVLLRRIYKTVLVSKELLRIAAAEYGLPPEKTQLILNGIDTEKFQPRRNPELRSRMGIPDGALVFGTVGRLRAEKNLELMLRAFAGMAMAGARLVVVGDGDCRRRWQALAESLGPGGQVLFTGATEDPAPYYGIFDVFLMSSITEQMPLALLEAMSCGLPAVCTAVGDTADMLGVREGPELAPSGDPRAYQEALRAMASNTRLRQELGAKNRRRSQGYSMSAMVSAYAGLYGAAVRAGGVR